MRIPERADLTVSPYVYLDHPKRFHINPHRQRSRPFGTTYLCADCSLFLSDCTQILPGGAHIRAGYSYILPGDTLLCTGYPYIQTDSALLDNTIYFAVTLRQYTVQLSVNSHRHSGDKSYNSVCDQHADITVYCPLNNNHTGNKNLYVELHIVNHETATDNKNLHAVNHETATGNKNLHTDLHAVNHKIATDNKRIYAPV